MPSSPWERAWEGNEDVAAPFEAGAVSRCAPGTWSGPCDDGVGHGCGRGVIAVAEGVDDRGLVGRRLVLAELGLADHSVDPDLDADNGLKQPVEVIGRSVRGLPWMELSGFVCVGEFVEQCAEPSRIFDGLDLSLNVDDLVIPRGNDTA